MINTKIKKIAVGILAAIFFKKWELKSYNSRKSK